MLAKGPFSEYAWQILNENCPVSVKIHHPFTGPIEKLATDSFMSISSKHVQFQGRGELTDTG